MQLWNDGADAKLECYMNLIFRLLRSIKNPPQDVIDIAKNLSEKPNMKSIIDICLLLQFNKLL